MLSNLTPLTLLLTMPLCTAQTSYDYIIIGGGTAGLVLANRLSTNPNLTVAVIEAGASVLNNPNVTSVTSYGLSLNSPIDYADVSAPQKYTGNRTLQYNAGKALGGTSAINGMTYLRAESVQIDAWEELGNEEWSWEDLLPFYLKSESFQSPTEEQSANGATFEHSAHGYEGPVAVGWSKYLTGQNVFSILRQTSEALGYPFNEDPNDGTMAGFSTWPLTLNASTSTREDAARAYYHGVADSRPNLHVYLNTTARRIVWSSQYPSSTSKVSAVGVETTSSTNITSTISLAKKGEVILSAGSIRSPLLLEASGVGHPSVLKNLDIDVIIDLPGVGAMQDQPNSAIAYASPVNFTGYPSFVTYATASDLFGSDLPSISSSVYANLSDYAARIIADAGPFAATTQENQERILKVHADVIFAENSTVPLAEMIWFPGAGSIASAFWNLLPFSRGYIHTTSGGKPDIQPNMFQLPIDELVQTAAAQRVRELFATPPLSEYVTAELVPDTNTVPPGVGYKDPAWGAWVKATYGTNNHPISTCAMMSKELGGVVDSEGRLYGAGNVRVVDASIIPMQVSGHLSATVYAAAEKIAAGIMEGQGKKS
jgi:choline dehydrogenase-like flavoprotein